MDWLVKMNKEGLLFPVSSTAGQVDQFLAVLTGKSAMMIETSGAATTIAAFLSGDLYRRGRGVAGVDVDPGAAQVGEDDRPRRRPPSPASTGRATSSPAAAPSSS